MRRWWVLAVTAALFLVLIAWTIESFGMNNMWSALAVVWLPMTWLGMASRVAPVRLPERYHELRSFELDGRVYELLGVRAFKALLRRGPFAWFNPGLHLPAERTTSDLLRLAQRMRVAEASHAVLFVATLPIAAVAVALGWWTAALWTFVFDVVVNGYPVMLQRYNRALLAGRFGLVGV